MLFHPTLDLECFGTKGRQVMISSCVVARSCRSKYVIWCCLSGVYVRWGEVVSLRGLYGKRPMTSDPKNGHSMHLLRS